jgi:hypothetical protein
MRRISLEYKYYFIYRVAQYRSTEICMKDINKLKELNNFRKMLCRKFESVRLRSEWK